MLSYMVPSLEEKPPPVPHTSSTSGSASKDHRLQLSLAPDRLTNGQLTNGHHPAPATAGTAPGGRKTAVSTESSASSLSSGDALPIHHDKPKPKLLNGATKHTSLKRVSFGSSKGSMVETLIYESPLQEEPEGSPTSSPDVTSASQVANDPENAGGAKAPSKVRVTFFESSRPLVVSSPEQSDELDATHAQTMTTIVSPFPSEHNTTYNRQESTDSGWDNPFRPDGDLSREADEIVQLIKGGKPITQTLQSSHVVDGTNGTLLASPQLQSSVASTTHVQSPAKGANGTTPGSDKPPSSSPTTVELQRGTVSTPNDASQVEQVNLKKKPKCKCCVIQ